MLVSEAFPELSEALRELLRDKGEAELAEQISVLKLVDRCHCGDDFCATMYTQAKPVARYGPDHRAMDLDADKGMIIPDVVEDKIVCIEILHRGEIRMKLLAMLP
jgi:hypothetical protein